jgi:hypothetical protein
VSATAPESRQPPRGHEWTAESPGSALTFTVPRGESGARRLRRWVVLAGSAGCYVLSVELARRPDPQYWSAVLAWLTAIGLLFAVSLGRVRWRCLPRRDWLILSCLVGVSVAARSVFLDIYPFHVFGDAIRDNGLYPVAVSSHTLPPFGWGPYESMMMVLPAFIAVFHRLFGGVHFFQICSIVVSAAELILLYILALRTCGRREAVGACLVITFLPAHLGFSRGETTMILTSFWTTALVAAACAYNGRREWHWLVTVGLLSGLAANFHASVRTIVFLTAGWIAVSEVLASRERRPGAPWKDPVLAARLTAWVAAALVGFGPSVLFVSGTFLHGGDRLVVDDVRLIGQRYVATLLTYVVLPLTGHLPFDTPVVTPFMGISLLAGAAVAFTKNAPALSRLVVGLLLIVPLTNSALTNAPFAWNRMAPVFPLVALAIGLSPRLLPNRPAWGAAMALVAVVGSAQHADFFFRQAPMSAIEAGGMTREMAYAFAHAVRVARERPELAGSEDLCWGASARQHEALQALHYRENLAFYLPGMRHRVIALPGVDDTAFYLSPTCPIEPSSQPGTQIVFCVERSRYRCGGLGPFTMLLP